MEANTIRWPEAHQPEGAALFVSNNILIPAATPEAVWAWLIRAQRWPTWYANCKWLRFDGNDQGPDLAIGTHFRWWTFAVPVKTIVEEFEPPHRLAWSGGTLGSKGYHAWLIEPRAQGCWVLTEETQRGIVPRVVGKLLRPQMLRWHQRWLEGLREQSSKDLPA